MLFKMLKKGWSKTVKWFHNIVEVKTHTSVTERGSLGPSFTDLKLVISVRDDGHSKSFL